jgi:hypothetical protein
MPRLLQGCKTRPGQIISSTAQRFQKQNQHSLQEISNTTDRAHRCTAAHSAFSGTDLLGHHANRAAYNVSDCLTARHCPFNDTTTVLGAARCLTSLDNITNLMLVGNCREAHLRAITTPHRPRGAAATSTIGSGIIIIIILGHLLAAFIKYYGTNTTTTSYLTNSFLLCFNYRWPSC